MNNNITKIAICTALLGSTAAPLSIASASESAWSTSANISLATEQAFRGRSQTNEKAALYGSLDVGHSSGFYAGVWGSNRAYAGGLELDLYAGFAKSGFNIGYVQYIYPNDEEFTSNNNGVGADFGELYIKYSFKGFTIGAAFSPDWFAETGDAQNYSIDWNRNILPKTNLALHLGINRFDDEARALPNHEDYSISITQKLTNNFSAFGSIVGTNLDRGNDSEDDRFIVGVKAAF